MRSILVALAAWAAQAAPALPDNPCDLLTIEEISKATGVTVTAAQRVRSRGEDKQSPLPPGSICRYETPSKYVSFSISVQRPPAATKATYSAERERYFAAFPGSAETVPGVGQDAWISGFAMIRVLVSDDVQFYVMIQGGPDSSGTSSAILTSAAKALVRRLGR